MYGGDAVFANEPDAFDGGCAKGSSPSVNKAAECRVPSLNVPQSICAGFQRPPVRCVWPIGKDFGWVAVEYGSIMYVLNNSN